MNNNENITKKLIQCFGNELPDELLSAISGGRTFREEENKALADFIDYYQTHNNGEDPMIMANAVARYYNYINSLPENSPTKLFVYSEWRQ